MKPAVGRSQLNGLKDVESLLQLNRDHSRIFTATRPRREGYRAKHATEIGAMKCMDGRVHLPYATNTPLGIIQPWRNLGGKFDLGWPHFGDTLLEWHNEAALKSRRCLMLVTYHFSRGDMEGKAHRGCAGFGQNTEEAIAFTHDLTEKMRQAFQDREQLFPIHCGFETDLDALILHSEDGSRTVDLSDMKASSERELLALLHELYPSMPRQIVEDFLPLVAGNIEHAEEIREANRSITEVVHREWILAFGRGFDWLHVPNVALIVGPYDIDLKTPIVTAAKLIRDNLDKGRIPQDQEIVLMTSSPYRERGGPEQKLREAKSRELTEFALKAIAADPVAKELLPRLRVLTTTVDSGTRQLDILSRHDSAEELLHSRY